MKLVSGMQGRGTRRQFPGVGGEDTQKHPQRIQKKDDEITETKGHTREEKNKR